MELSILVCTRNRVAGLPMCLDAIAATLLDFGRERGELVIVDNGSSDGTGDYLKDWAARQDVAVHIVTETRPGLARARNAGLAATKGAIVAMTDDDCVVAQDFAAAAHRSFAEDSALAIVGGRIELGAADDLPITIKTDTQPSVFDPIRMPGGYIMGANLSIPRKVIDMLGPFDERFGAGAPFIAAEDTDFLFRAMQRGVVIRYDPRIQVLHYHGRKTQADALKLYQGYSYGDGALTAKFFLSSPLARVAASRLLKSSVREILRLDPPKTGMIRHVNLFKFRHQLRGAGAYIASQLRGR